MYLKFQKIIFNIVQNHLLPAFIILTKLQKKSIVTQPLIGTGLIALLFAPSYDVIILVWAGLTVWTILLYTASVAFAKYTQKELNKGIKS